VFRLLIPIVIISCSVIATAINLSLTQQLILAPSRNARYALLKDEDFLFDFGKGPSSELSTGGYLAEATSETFPALFGQGVGMAVGILGPCGFNTPHTHVGGSEFFIALNGTIHSYLALEPPPINSGATPRVINHTINALQATIFPQGSTHMQINPSCEIRAFVASFGTDDFGRTQQFETLFSIPDDVLQDSLGNTLSPSQIDNIRQKIPSPVMKSINQCRVVCGMPPHPEH
jgi:hypothetical protein